MHAATTPRHGSVRYLLAGRFRQMATTEWGDPAAPPLLCAHGLTRNGRDFDVLAATLSDRFHVVAPDLPGRGQSDWLEDPDLYRTPSYLAALAHLLARFDQPVDFLGTSLGGICGMEMAALPNQPIRRLVLNDIGPLVPAAALARIRDYLCAPLPRFADPAMLKLYLRRVHAPFGPLTDAQWLRLAETSARPLSDGSVTLHYDPAIAVVHGADVITDLDMWAQWCAIEIPILTVRGEWSDVLLPETLAAMAAKSRCLQVPLTGHAPALLDAPTIEAVRDFLTAP